jgi:hypothetical protein
VWRSLIVSILIGACSKTGEPTTRLRPRGPALPALPSQGGPAWVELQSEHFTLWTDGSEERGRVLIRRMEHLRQIILGVGLSTNAATGRSFVLALRDREEVGVFVPKQFVAYSWANGGAIRQPLILIPSNVEGEDATVVTHELSHVISYYVIRNQPRWFAEGLANFFATVRLDPDQARGDVGKPLDYIVSRLRTNRPTPVATMIACNRNECMDDMFYATAWAMFTFLANTYPKELVRYSEQLDQFPANSPQAWQDAFPKLTPDAFDSELRKWLAYGRHTVWKFNVKLQTWPITKRALLDGDVLAARGLLRYMFDHEKPEPPVELADALRVDPSNVLATLITATIRKKIDVEDARRVAADHPDDWRAWYLVGWATNGQGEEGRKAREQTCSLMANARVQVPPQLCSTP